MIKFKTELFDHQKKASEKLSKIKVGALYMEQGTGKTRAALEIAKNRQEKNKFDIILWLCPCSVKKNLREDINFHCENDGEIIIKGIESISMSDKLYLLLTELVKRYRCFLIVDESNLVKNKNALRTERIIELSKYCKYKLILNGTPITRNEADLFAQWFILDWRILGYKSYYSFAANHLEYEQILTPNGNKITTNRVKNVLNIDYLTEKIAPYSFQISKKECLDIPTKQYYSYDYSLTEEQWEEYDKTKERFLLEVKEWKPETIYRLFTATQHVVTGRKVITNSNEKMVTKDFFNEDIENPRIQCLLEIVNKIGKEKCIIFCKYQNEVDTIMKLIKNCVEFTGRISQKNRQINREKFKNDVQYLVANKQCGAYGLNLQFCHNIIFYSNDFDLGTRAQAEDRVHRIGQKHKVNIYDIIALDTIDKMIYDCIIKKESMLKSFKRGLKSKNDKDWSKYRRKAKRSK